MLLLSRWGVCLPIPKEAIRSGRPNGVGHADIIVHRHILRTRQWKNRPGSTMTPSIPFLVYAFRDDRSFTSSQVSKSFSAVDAVANLVGRSSEDCWNQYAAMIRAHLRLQSIRYLDPDLPCIFVVTQELHTPEVFHQPIRASAFDSLNAVGSGETQHCAPGCFTGPNARWSILNDKESASDSCSRSFFS